MERRSPRRPRRPATTAPAREDQLISLGYDLAEKQLAEGTASSQVITHFLKMGSRREALEHERLRQENLLLAAKIDQLSSAKRVEELYEDALKAMKRYQGDESGEEYEEYDEYEPN